MSVVYSGEHSINFYKTDNSSVTKKNTWTDFHLIPAEKPYINYPAPNVRIVTLPGTNKRVDITDLHVGGLTFGGRTGTWEFYIDHNQWIDWRASYDAVCDFIHAKELIVALADEPTMFYSGVFTINAYNSGSSYSKVAIQYDLGYESFVRSDILPHGCPINFVQDNGIEYGKNYGYVTGADYVTDQSDDSKIVEIYNLITL